jgi:hypothetical protein
MTRSEFEKKWLEGSNRLGGFRQQTRPDEVTPPLCPQCLGTGLAPPEPVPTPPMEKVTVYPTPEQMAALRWLSEQTRVPFAVYIRQGVDLMLDREDP